MTSLRVRSAPLALFAALSCSSANGPRSGLTLLVTNATCSGGACSVLRVLGFPTNGPNTPGGPWALDLGRVTGSSACLVLPPSATFQVVAEPSGDTKTYTWTTGDPISVGAVPPSASLMQWGPSTAAFVPNSAPAWSVTLPGSTDVSPGRVCAP